MALSWSARRKTLYTISAGIVGLIVLAYAYDAFLSNKPTCFDGVQNGDEAGVDCGGSCALICRQQSHAPIVLWSRVFKTSPTTYTVAAYLENDNAGAGATKVPYAFQLFDADNNLILERDGTIDLPPVQTIPIVEPNITLNNQTPARVLFSLGGLPVWYKISATQIPSLHVVGQQLSTDASRLSATLANDSLGDAHNVTVVGVLFDASGTAQAASKSVVDVPRKGSTPVVFTFPGGVANVIRAEITVLPSF